MKILLVEDNPGDIRLLQEIFLKSSDANITIDLAKSLSEAHECLNIQYYDLVLLDLSLPDGQGVETVASIKNHHPVIPIVVLTGLDDDVIALNAMREGAQDYIVKGAFDVNLVTRTLKYAIERKRSEQKLRAALNRAELANRAKTNFLAHMSHELRTPLNAIIGFSELLQCEVFGPLGDPRYAEYAGDILQSGQYLLNLINDLLDLSKAEAGKLELNETSVDLYDIVQECLTLTRLSVEKKKLTIQVDLDYGLRQLYVDGRFTKQIILNILSNGIKFSRQSGEIKIFTFMKHDGSIVLSISDNGIGMARGDIIRAMEPFGQIQNVSHIEGHQGTGLGLPLAKHMIELHGGSLTLDSELHVGTSVSIHFPAWRVRHGARADPSSTLMEAS
jgi:signal transduction histidine kinase